MNMSQDNDRQIIELLSEIRDTQREIARHLAAQRALAEEQVQKHRARMDESIDLQREALKRQRTITTIAAPGIIACIVAIAYLVFRYF